MGARRVFETLDGIRGLAALFVFTRHTQAFWGGLLFFHSYLAVDMFFLLSGFVIGHAYEEKMAAGKLSRRGFMAIRLIRLYPMYFLSVILSVLALWSNAVRAGTLTKSLSLQLAASFALSLFFLPSYISGVGGITPLNNPFWSLFYEIWSNVAYAAGRKRLGKRTFWNIIGACAAGLAICCMISGTVDSGFLWRPVSWFTGMFRCGFGMAAGLLYRRIYQEAHAQSAKGGLLHCEFPAWLPMLLLSACLAAPSLGRLDCLFDLAAILLVFPCCLVMGARSAISGPWKAAARWLGLLSYPLYVLHIPAQRFFQCRWEPFILQRAPGSGFLLLLFLAGFCSLLEYAYDQPLRKWLTARFLPQKRAAGDAGSALP